MAFGIDPSALNGASLRLAVIGNNITNSGVNGFKGSDFSATLASSGQGGGNSIAGSRQLFTQGTINSSNNPLDMAINGNGFYILKRYDQSTAYTRDGSFNLDKDGYIVNPTGDRLLGYGTDNSGEINVGKNINTIKVDTSNSAPLPTSNVGIHLVLNSNTTTTSGTQSTIPVSTIFNPEAAATYTSTTISTVYDAQGTSHDLQTYYVNRSGTTQTNANSVVDAFSFFTSTGTPSGLSLYSTLYNASIAPGATSVTVYNAMKNAINTISPPPPSSSQADLLSGLDNIYNSTRAASAAVFAQALAGTGNTQLVSSGSFTLAGLQAGLLSSATGNTNQLTNAAFFFGTPTASSDLTYLNTALTNAVNASGASAQSVYTAMKNAINSTGDSTASPPQGFTSAITPNIKKDLLNGLDTQYASTNSDSTAASFARQLMGVAPGTSTNPTYPTLASLSSGIFSNLTLPQNTWDVYATMTGNNLLGSKNTQVTFGQPNNGLTADQEPTSVRLYFDSTGNLIPDPNDPKSITMTYDSSQLGKYNLNFQLSSSQKLSNGGTQAVATPVSGSVGLDLSGARQISADFLASTSQNGFPVGQFQNLSVDSSGILFAHYSSGATSKVGEVALATFKAPTALAQDRNNQFIQTYASGEPTINIPGKGGAGQIIGSSVEAAGVDLTSEMIKLISAQRAYQANSEVVKRQDQILQTVIGIGQ